MESSGFMEAPKVIYVVSNKFPVEDAVDFAFSNSCDFMIIDSRRLGSQLTKQLRELGFIFITSTEAARGHASFGTPTHLYVLTSGTTSAPKIVKKNLVDMNTFQKVSALGELRWFVPAPIGSFAWYQMIFLARAIKSQSLVLTDSDKLMSDFEFCLTNRTINAISCSPTFLRIAATSIDSQILRNSGVVKVTLGGEVISESDISLCEKLFPESVLNHIYASTELGPVFISSDGCAGYSTNRYIQGVDFEIVEDELFVQRKLSGSQSTWVSTGDLAFVREGRLIISGRKNKDFINVGGNRVSLKKIEQQISSLEEIRWVRAYAVPSSFMGCLVGIEIVCAGGYTTTSVEAELDKLFLNNLSDFETPRKVTFLESIPLSESLKS